MENSLVIITPIYKEVLNPIELSALSHSLKGLSKYQHTFFAPEGLKANSYIEKFPNSNYLFFPAPFFTSQRAYNQLCYEVGFYKCFLNYTYILILQTDALVIRPDKLDFWVNSSYDFVGAPECALYRYDISGIPPFDRLNGALKTISMQGLNGGLSLRRVKKIIEVLDEFPHITSFFRSYAGGVGEDIFFSVLSRISRKNFLMPNEILASSFALTGNFADWLEFNDMDFPFGVHAWFRSKADQDYISNLIGVIE